MSEMVEEKNSQSYSKVNVCINTANNHVYHVGDGLTTHPLLSY